MSEPKDTKAADLAKGLGDFEVAELDDKDLEEVAGGTSGNTNCGCAPGYPSPSGDNNGNCGCSGTTPIKQNSFSGTAD